MTARTALLTALLAFGAVGCTSFEDRLSQFDRTFESLSATTRAACESWLSGVTSGTYTVQALTQTYQLLEQERTSLAASPQTLADPRGAERSQRAERLSRLIADAIGAVRNGDASSVRHHISELPAPPQENK